MTNNSLQPTWHPRHHLAPSLAPLMAPFWPFLRFQCSDCPETLAPSLFLEVKATSSNVLQIFNHFFTFKCVKTYQNSSKRIKTHQNDQFWWQRHNILAPWLFLKIKTTSSIESKISDDFFTFKWVKTHQICQNGQFWSQRPKILATCSFLKVITNTKICSKCLEHYLPVKDGPMCQCQC